MSHTFVEFRRTYEVEAGEKRGEVIYAVAEHSPKSEFGERRGKMVNRLVKFWPKSDRSALSELTLNKKRYST